MYPFEPSLSLAALIVAFAAGFVVGRFTRTETVSDAKPEASLSNGRLFNATDAAADLLPEIRADVEMLIAEDRKIEAIRVARSALGLGLKEAKDLVEFIERNPAGGGARVY